MAKNKVVGIWLIAYIFALSGAGIGHTNPQFYWERAADYPMPFTWNSYQKLDAEHFSTVNPSSAARQYTFSINKEEYCTITDLTREARCFGKPLYGVPDDIDKVRIASNSEHIYSPERFFDKHAGLTLPPMIKPPRAHDVNYYYPLPPNSYLELDQAGFTAARDEHNQLIVMKIQNKTDLKNVITGEYRGFVLSPQGSYLILK